jgi:hypothetical protein
LTRTARPNCRAISIGGAENYFCDDHVRGSDSLTFQAGPLLSWSFPNLTIARSRIRQAEAQSDASLAAFDGRVLTALKEVEQALSTVAAEQQQYDSFREARDRSQKAYDLANLRYRGIDRLSRCLGGWCGTGRSLRGPGQLCELNPTAFVRTGRSFQGPWRRLAESGDC